MSSIRGLYVITADCPGGTEELLWRAAAVLDGGARLLQYRDKSEDAERRLREADALGALCRQYGALFIVNDDAALAARVGADGVHLGRDDAAVAAARRLLPAAALVGVSCYDSPQRARLAAAAGADYLAFGSFFPSRVKPDAVRPPPSLLGTARRDLGLPCVAIGGITAANAGALIAAGADAVAIITSVFLAADPRAAAAEVVRLFC